MKYFLVFFYLLFFYYLANAGEIHKAAEKGDIKKVSSFLKVGIDPDLVNENGATPLNFAIHGGNLKIASLLIKHGAKVNNNEKLPPLIQASALGHLEFVSLLLKYGANVNTKIKGSNGTALHSSVLSESKLEYQIKELRSKGMKVRSKEVTLLLLKNGANVNAKNKNGVTPLYFVLSAEIATLLLKYGARASVNVKTKEGDRNRTHFSLLLTMILRKKVFSRTIKYSYKT
ncbi:MAG: ankyrin repeat domain-containing protein [Bdellovibrionales bacterium]|nr:ankyrin repeat domain-containing protein [Bdellovibrionales bacterium]